MRSMAVLWSSCSRPCLFASPRLSRSAAPGVQVVADEAQRRVDITIDGKPFTSYLVADHAEEAGALSADHR